MLERLERIGKGKRGIVTLARYGGERVAVKSRNPAAAVDTIAHESRVLALVNARGIGPRRIALLPEGLVMEYVRGTPVMDWIATARASAIRAMLVALARQCRILDELGIEKQELTRPYKHVLIVDGEPVQLDFERARRTRRPKNVTQFCQWLVTGRMRAALAARGIRFPRDILIAAARAYKRAPDDRAFAAIVAVIGTQVTPFQERVYGALLKVPRGEVTTYGVLAKELGSSPRAVGQALRRNPFAPFVPCHRVIAADGSIGGFNGHRAGKDVARKAALLAAEGAGPRKRC